MKQNLLNWSEKAGQKFIETPSLVIKKNIMTWENTMIQLSNISYISATDIPMASLPILAVLAIPVGLILLKESLLLAIALIAAGTMWLYFWYTANEKRRQGAVLTIRMNSGHNLYFTFENKKFLLKVLDVLENIIISGGVSSPVSINIKGCTINDSKLFTDISM